MKNYSEIYNVKYLFKPEEIECYFEFRKRKESGDQEPALEYANLYLITRRNELEKAYKEMSAEEFLEEKDRELYNIMHERLELYYTKETDYITDEELIRYTNTMRGMANISPYFQIRLEVFERKLKEKGFGGY